MGEIADAMLEGILCEWCGTYIEESLGVPMLCSDCWEQATPKQRAGWKCRHEGCSERCKVCFHSTPGATS